MALQQRIERKGSGCQLQSMPGRRINRVNAGTPAYTFAAAKDPYACNLNTNKSGISTGTYPHASNTSIAAFGMPTDKHLHACNAAMPVQNTSRSKQASNHSTSRISQQATLDVAVPSSFWRLRPHVSLDFDAHRQKVVPKRNQVAASWRHLSPHLKWKKHEVTGVADVFEVPPELFKLTNLGDILSLEAWKECLSLSERRFLRQLLPEGLDHGALVRTILRGDNFFFGSPLANWGGLLLDGELHPDNVEQREVELKQTYDEHYLELQNYHEKMLETLGDLKEEWILCKSKKNLSSKTRRRKFRLPDSKAVADNAFNGSFSWQNSKRQKVANCQEPDEIMDLPHVKETDNIMTKLDNGMHSDGYIQSMHVLKVTRKQYDDILQLFVENPEELSVDALSPLLNLQQKLEISCINSLSAEDNIKTHKHWSKLVVEQIPAGHIAFCKRKLEKCRVSKLTAEQCMQFCSMFMDKSESNAVLPLEVEEPALGFQGSIEAEDKSRNSSASESSVTCLEGKAETQCPVDSCLSSADSARRVPPQHLIQEDQVSLIDLPHGSSLARDVHATLLSPAPREKNNFKDYHLFDGHRRPFTGSDSVPPIETDILLKGNHAFVSKTCLLKSSVGPEGIDSDGKELINWDMHSKPASDVVSAAAASGVSEEVEQRVTLQPGCQLNYPLYCPAAPGSLAHQDTAGKEPFLGSRYHADTKSGEHIQYQALPEKILNLNAVGRSPLSVPATEEIARSEKVNAKDANRVLQIECSHVESETNNQMMLRLFLDDPKPHSNDFLSTDASSSQGLQGKSSFCESNEVPSLASHRVNNPMLRDHEPMTELSLLVDDRAAKQTYHTEQAESVSSRTQNEYFQHCTMEPQWITRHNRREELVPPFRQDLRDLHHLVQSNQDASSPMSFSPMQPMWQHNGVGHVPAPSFGSYWNMGEHVDHTSWIPSDSTVGSLFLPGKDECGRPPVSHYWDQASQGPCMSSQSVKHEHSFLRGNTLNLYDEQMYASLENWTRLQSQASSHLQYAWAMDRSGRVSSHPWKNNSGPSSSQYEQHKLQSTVLSKLNPNFSTSWH